MNSLEKKYDVCIAYAGPMDFISKFILDKTTAKIKLQWIHFDVSQCGFNVEFAKNNYKKFNKIIVVSNEAKKSLIEAIPDLSGKIETIPNFLPINLCLEKSLEFNPYTLELSNTFIILTVGRLSKEKGQYIIPDIVKKLLDKGMNNFVWYIVGDGKLFGEINQVIHTYKLENYIKLEGTQLNPYPYYKYCDLYVQTSLHEGYCITIAEALLFGKYVISTDVAGAYDQIDSIEKGLILKNDTDIICDAIFNYYEELKNNEYEN